MSLKYCDETSLKQFAEYLFPFINQMLETELPDYNLVLFNGLSAAHFAKRLLDFERLQLFIETKRLMKVRLEQCWSRNEDYILVRLV
jgi:hypothetical protein